MTIPGPERLRPPLKVVLDGGVRVALRAVDVPTPIGPIGCWSYLTEGLIRHDQAELLFLLRRTPLDLEPSNVPLHAFAAIAACAARGELVRAGARTGFAPHPYFAQRGWAGWIYLPPQRGAGVAPTTLHAVAVTPEELALAGAVGATRVAARLGRAAHYWPCPPWSEPHPPFAAPDELARSILAQVRVLGGLDVTVTRASERIRVQLPKRFTPELRQALAALPPDAPLALAAVLGDWADGLMVWAPGQPAPAAISAPGCTGQRLAAAFILFVPQQDADAASLVEDGLAVRLTDATWARLRAALADAAPFSRMVGDERLELEWV